MGASQRRAEHHRVGSTGDRLGDVTAVAHTAICDHADVVTGLEHVLRAGGRNIGDRRRLRDAQAKHAAGGADRPGSNADKHTLGTGPHQMQARVIRGTATDDHGNRRELADELLEVQRRPAGVQGDVLGGDDGALDDEDVEAGVERYLVVLADLLRRQRGGGDDTMRLDLLDPLRDQLRLYRLAIDVLELTCGDVLREGRDTSELFIRVLVPTLNPLEVEHGEAAELAEDARRRRRDDAVERGCKKRQLEAVRTQGPADVDVVGVTRPA